MPGVLSFAGMSSNPQWFGRRYPTLDDLLAAAEACGCAVGSAPIPIAMFVPAEGPAPAVILLPRQAGLLERCWLLAHELGHLHLHAGPRGPLLEGRDEAAADRWAARALIPQARVARHGNASLDAFIAALSAHYEDLPLFDCPARRLAARIATIRLRAVQEVA